MVPGPLGQYQKKRDFSKTSEPRGEGSAEPATGQRFVVQKHRARHLHYDLRLEMEGVLKSWAVPKGPSLNPEEKRLAIHVEDHPLEYFDFEGVIPPGEYGAGQVIVWDSGTYQYVGSETDPAKALRKGAIELHLRGTKLKGLWLLVRIKREENQWLFFKQQDAHADPQRDLLQEQPESVLSGLPIEEMVEGQSRTWNIRLRRLLEELNLPLKQIESNVRPMLATLASRVPSGKRWPATNLSWTVKSWRSTNKAVPAFNCCRVESTVARPAGMMRLSTTWFSMSWGVKVTTCEAPRCGTGAGS